MFLGTVLLLMIPGWCQPYSFPSLEEASIDELNRMVQESSHEDHQDHPKTDPGSNARRSKDDSQDESHFDFLEDGEGDDVKDFQSISIAGPPESLRRYEYRKPLGEDVEDNPHYNLGAYYKNMYHFYDMETQVLWWKEEVMHNLCRDYLYLARHKVAWALKRRNPIRKHRRYRLGYLFARLRRIQTEMLRILTYANERGNLIENYPSKTYSSHPQGYQKEFEDDYTVWQPGTKYLYPRYYNITTLMRLYERLSRLDRDSRDTVVLLKETYASEVLHQQEKHNESLAQNTLSGRPAGK